MFCSELVRHSLGRFPASVGSATFSRSGTICAAGFPRLGRRRSRLAGCAAQVVPHSELIARGAVPDERQCDFLFSR